MLLLLYFLGIFTRFVIRVPSLLYKTCQLRQYDLNRRVHSVGSNVANSIEMKFEMTIKIFTPALNTSYIRGLSRSATRCSSPGQRPGIPANSRFNCWEEKRAASGLGSRSRSRPNDGSHFTHDRSEFWVHRSFINFNLFIFRPNNNNY